MLEARNVWELVEQRAEASPDSRMSVDENGRSITFARVPRRRRAGGCRVRLASASAPATSCRGCCPPGSSRSCWSARCARLGAVQNPILPIYRDREVGLLHRSGRHVSCCSCPATWRDFDYEAMAHRIADEAGRAPAGRRAATGSCPTAIRPSSRRPRPPPAPPRATRRSAGSSTRRAPPPTRRARGTPTATSSSPPAAWPTGSTCATGDRNLMAFPFTHIGGRSGCARA